MFPMFRILITCDERSLRFYGSNSITFDVTSLEIVQAWFIL